MRIEEIEKLLAAFYEGNTTESEENVLKTYFETQDVPPHLEKEKRLFRSFRQEQEVVVPVGLEEKISQLIDARSRDEASAAPQHTKKAYRWRWIGGVAASILLLLGVGYGINSQQSCDSSHPQETFSDPKEAYEALQSALIEVSSGLNSGIEQVVESQKEIKNAHQEIMKETH